MSRINEEIVSISKFRVYSIIILTLQIFVALDGNTSIWFCYLLSKYLDPPSTFDHKLGWVFVVLLDFAFLL